MIRRYAVAALKVAALIVALLILSATPADARPVVDRDEWPGVTASYMFAGRSASTCTQVLSLRTVYVLEGEYRCAR